MLFRSFSFVSLFSVLFFSLVYCELPTHVELMNQFWSKACASTKLNQSNIGRGEACVVEVSVLVRVFMLDDEDTDWYTHSEFGKTLFCFFLCVCVCVFLITVFDVILYFPVWTNFWQQISSFFFLFFLHSVQRSVGLFSVCFPPWSTVQ